MQLLSINKSLGIDLLLANTAFSLPAYPPLLAFYSHSIGIWLALLFNNPSQSSICFTVLRLIKSYSLILSHFICFTSTLFTWFKHILFRYKVHRKGLSAALSETSPSPFVFHPLSLLTPETNVLPDSEGDRSRLMTSPAWPWKLWISEPLSTSHRQQEESPLPVRICANKKI